MDFGTGFGPYDVSVADVNGDGFDDVVTGNFNPFADFGFEGITVLLNQSCNNALIDDVNRDGVVDLLDVEPFKIQVISGGFQVEADVNGDGKVDLLDIAGFVDLLAE